MAIVENVKMVVNAKPHIHVTGVFPDMDTMKQKNARVVCTMDVIAEHLMIAKVVLKDLEYYHQTLLIQIIVAVPVQVDATVSQHMDVIHVQKDSGSETVCAGIVVNNILILQIIAEIVRKDMAIILLPIYLEGFVKNVTCTVVVTGLLDVITVFQDMKWTKMENVHSVSQAMGGLLQVNVNLVRNIVFAKKPINAILVS